MRISSCLLTFVLDAYLSLIYLFLTLPSRVTSVTKRNLLISTTYNYFFRAWLVPNILTHEAWLDLTKHLKHMLVTMYLTGFFPLQPTCARSVNNALGRILVLYHRSWHFPHLSCWNLAPIFYYLCPYLFWGSIHKLLVIIHSPKSFTIRFFIKILVKLLWNYTIKLLVNISIRHSFSLCCCLHSFIY